MKFETTKMAMPVKIEVSRGLLEKDFDIEKLESVISQIYDFFDKVDMTFSTYKKDSEISKINNRVISIFEASPDISEILVLSEIAKEKTNGYFNIRKGEAEDSYIDPLGIVKGWAIKKASDMLLENGFRNFYVEVAGDIQTSGYKEGKKWKVGIKNPFNKEDVVKVLELSGEGVATSGNYERGDHIYLPKNGNNKSDLVSVTIVAEDVCVADIYATAIFAMGDGGILFAEGISDENEKLNSFSNIAAYMIDKNQIGTKTTNFYKYENNIK